METNASRGSSRSQIVTSPRPAAGLKRLQLEARIRQPLSPEQSLPAVGQGAVGIECRLDDAWTRGLLAPLNHTAPGLASHGPQTADQRFSLR